MACREPRTENLEPGTWNLEPDTLFAPMKFAPEYITYVLNENFEDAKELFLSPLMAIHYAHLVMLADRGIVSADNARTLRDALDAMSEADVRRAQYDATFEDLFFYIDRLVLDACGDDF